MSLYDIAAAEVCLQLLLTMPVNVCLLQVEEIALTVTLLSRWDGVKLWYALILITASDSQSVC